MKNPPKCLYILILLISIATTAQEKNCETTTDQPALDYNSIAINKCAVKAKEDVDNTKKARQIQIKRSNFKKHFLIKRTKSEVTSLASDVSAHGVESTATENTDLIKKQVILVSKTEALSSVYTFSEVDRIPLFKDCKEVEKSRQKSCFNTQITSFIVDNIEYPEDAYDDELNGIVTVKFTINNEGKIDDLLVSQSQEGDILKQAVTKLVKRLPKFTPAQKELQNVATQYEFSLNFSF